MRPRIRNIERSPSWDARIIVTLASFSLFFLGFQAKVAATPVPRQLYGKSVTISMKIHQTFSKETSGQLLNLDGEQATTFYFSSAGRIFARFTSRNLSGLRTYEQVGSDPNKIQHPTVAPGNPGTGATTFQDFHFADRTLIAIQKVGENGTRRSTIEFDQNFRSCTYTHVLRSQNGKPIRRIGGGGYAEIISGETQSNLVCMIRDGNAFAQ